MRLYHYHGSISGYSEKTAELRFPVRIVKIFVEDDHNPDIAPTRLTAYGELADYLHSLEWSDSAERYMDVDFTYDYRLNLQYIVIPTADNGEEYFKRPAKVIAIDNSSDVHIFGQADLLDTADPEEMTEDQYEAWQEFKRENFDL